MQIDIDAFCSWLCLHEHDVVGTPGTLFHNPLAQWLYDSSGHVYGVKEKHYGRASQEETQWTWLPCWARMFNMHAECRAAFREMTGAQAFVLLANIATLLPTEQLAQ